MAALAGGAGAAQLLAAAIAPLLTRLYTPEDFGVLAVYTGIISLIGVMSTGQFYQAIPLPKSEADAANLASLSLLLVLLTSGMTALLVVPFGGQLASVLRAPGLADLAWLIPLGVVGVAAYEITSTYAIRKKSFGLLARTRILQGMGQSGAQLGLGAGGSGPFGLIIGQVLGQSLGTGSLAVAAWKTDKAAFEEVSFAGMTRTGSRYRRFPLLWSWAVILNTLGTQAPPLLLSAFFGGTVTGLFALGQRLAMMPVMLVAKSTSQVFFALAAESDREQIGTETSGLFAKMFRAGLPFFPIVVLAAPQLVAVLFGSEWRESGVYIRWLSPWLFLLFVTIPLTPLVRVLERQGGELVFQGALFVGRVASIVAGARVGDPRLAVALYGSTSALIWGGYLVWILRISRAPWGLGPRAIASTVFVTLCVTAPLLIALRLGLSDGTVSGLAVSCGMLPTCLLVRSKRRRPS